MIFYDIIVVGSGLVGGLLSIALGRLGFKVAVVEATPKDKLINPDFDGRTTAVSLGSQQIFNAVGIWDDLKAYAEPILDIKVYEHDSPWSIHYDHETISENPMGFIVDNLAIRRAILGAVESSKNLTYMIPERLQDIEVTQTKVTAMLESGKEISASLLIGAEGRNSPSRKLMGIDAKTWSYDQVATVFTVEHEKPHHNFAWEVFVPEGPLAFLPLPKCPKTHQNRSGVVWTESSKKASCAYDLEEGLLNKTLSEMFQFYGDLKLVGRRWHYPLTALKAKDYVRERFALVGDSAHVVHPVAGQGVNLGWRDAACLADVLFEAKSLGLDIGQLTTLKKYEKGRRKDTLSILAMTDGMNRLFSNDSSILHFVRNSGFGFVNRLPILKNQLMVQAMGTNNIRPRIAQKV